jgi:hypothetical protein
VTQDELQVLSYLYLCRTQGLDAAVKPEFVPEVHRLTEQGWVERRWYEGDLVWRLSDKGMVSLQLAGLHRTSPADQN